MGTQVVLTGLQAAPEHNGKKGVVESLGGERLRIKILSDGKVMAIRPKNLQLAPREVESLSVKELKQILQACEYKGTTTGMDKRDLQEAVTNLSTAERNAEILVTHARQQQSSSQTTTTAASSSSTPSASGPAFTKEQMQTAADRMSSMDPAMLRQQAAMMKAMPPEQLRRSNPMFANMSDAQIQQMISQFEMMASNPAMMAQAANQMKNMSPEELERQRQSVLGTTSSSTSGGSTNSTGTSTEPSSTPSVASTSPSSSSSFGSATPPSGNTADMLRTMNPEQLKQQAAMLKSMPPSQIRSMHPQFSSMSDDQIEQMAAQMEMMADNPAMLKMAADAMGNMTPEQIADIQQGRMPSNMGMAGSGGSPGTTGAPTMDQAANLLSSMSGKQVKDMLKMAKENPDMLRTAMPGADTKQMEGMINRLESMDEKTLDRILGFLTGLQKTLSPVIKGYQSANQAVGGHLFKLIAFAFVALVWYVWFGGGKSGAAAAVVAPLAEEDVVPTLPDMADEFDRAAEF